MSELSIAVTEKEECIGEEKEEKYIVEKKLCTDGIRGVTNKLTIKSYDEKNKCIIDYDIYVHTGWIKNKLVYIDIFLSGIHGHNIRTLVEQICNDARLLITNGICDVDEVMDNWRGREFKPNGLCEQLVDIENGEYFSNPKSILDAVARLIQAKKNIWLKNMDK